jgi:Protein of unknown function (DUF2905)
MGGGKPEHQLPLRVISLAGLNWFSERQGYTQGMVEIGRMLLVLGVALVVIGGIVVLLGRTGLPLGRLPGDIVYRGKNTTFYFPLATSIVLSILLSVIMFLVSRFKR